MENGISIIDSITSGFALWKKYFVKIIIVGFIVYIPTQLCIELATIKLDEVLSYSFDDIRLRNNIYELIRYLIGSVAFLGIINFIVKILDNEEEQTVSEIVLHGLKRWPKFIETGFFAGIKVLLYFLLLIIPGIYKSVRFAFIDCVVSTNSGIFTDPCDKSEKLVENRWWRVFGFLLLIFIIGILFELIFLIPLFFYPEIFESTVMAIALGVIIKVLETYFIVVKAVYYFNLKKQNAVV